MSEGVHGSRHLDTSCGHSSLRHRCGEHGGDEVERVVDATLKQGATLNVANGQRPLRERAALVCVAFAAIAVSFRVESYLIVRVELLYVLVETSTIRSPTL